MLALVTTTQLIGVIAGVLTAHLIWNNPPPCPEEFMKLEKREMVKLCEYKHMPYGRIVWVLKKTQETEK